METTNTLQGLVKSAENQNPQQSNDLAVKTESLEEGRRKRKNKWTDCFDKRFGRLLVISFLGKGKNNNHIFECLCDCGAKTNVCSSALNGGATKSCGCLAREKTAQRNRDNQKSGHWVDGKTSKIAGTYYRMIDRCYGERPRDKRYRDRAITVCDRWRFGESGKTGMECFTEDMQQPNDQSLSIDRIDNNLGYFPENCRWATALTQSNNTSTNRKIEYAGENLTLTQWGRKLNIGWATIWQRLNAGWSVEEALTKLVRKLNKAT